MRERGEKERVEDDIRAGRSITCTQVNGPCRVVGIFLVLVVDQFSLLQHAPSLLQTCYRSFPSLLEESFHGGSWVVV